MATIPNVVVPKVATDPFRNTLLIGCLPDGQTNTSNVAIYSKTTGLDVSATDFYPDQAINELILTAGSGNISLILWNKGEIVLPVTVASGDIKEILRGLRVQQVLVSGTTYSGYIFPIF